MIFIGNSSEYTEINNVWSFQDYKNEKDLLSNFFENLCKILHFWPDINQLILVCIPSYPLSKEAISKFIRSYKYKDRLLYAPEDLIDKLPALLLNTKIFTEKDLHDNKLKNFINGDKVVTYAKYLSRKFIKIIHSIQPIEIYRESFASLDVDDSLSGNISDNNLYMDFLIEYSIALMVDDLRKSWGKNDKSYMDAWSALFPTSHHPVGLYKSMMRNVISAGGPKWDLHDILDKDLNNIVECFEDKGERYPAVVGTFYKDGSKVFDGLNRKINLVGPGEYLINHIVADLENKYGMFYSYDSLGVGNLIIENNEKGMVIFNADKLDQSNFQKIKSDLNLNKLTEKFYILHSSKPLYYLRDPSFKIIILPTHEHILYVLDRLIKYMSNKIFEREDFDAIRVLLYHERVLSIFKMIPSLEELENELLELKSGKYFSTINFKHRDFWYDYYLYIKQKYPSGEEIVSPTNKVIPAQSQLQEGEKTPATDEKRNEDKVLDNSETDEKEPESKTVSHNNKSNEENSVNTSRSEKKPRATTERKITFTLDSIQGQWDIEDSNSDDILHASYHNSLGIMFLLILNNYHSFPNKPISSKNLYSLAKKWQKKNDSSTETTNYPNTISGSVRHDFSENKLPGLEFIKKHIFIKSKKCYFNATPEDSNFELSIDVIPPLPENPDTKDLRSWAAHS